VQCSKCKSEMKEEKVQVPDERALLPTMVERTQFTCVNPKCESFNRPVILKPLPGPRFQRGTKFLSDLEQWRLEQLRKVAMASGLESTSLKVVDAIGTYLMAGLGTLMEISQGAPSVAVRVRAGEAQRKMGEQSGGQLVTLSPGDVIVTDRKTHKMVLHKLKSEWTKEDEAKYVTADYLLQWGQEFSPEWLIEQLRGDDLQAELLRLFYNHFKASPGMSLKVTAKEAAARIGKDQAEVRSELDKLEKRGLFHRTERGEYFTGPPLHPRVLEKPKPPLEQQPQQVTHETQCKIAAACLRILREVAISSEFDDTALKVVEAIETMEAAAPALVEVEISARSPAVRTYAHEALVRRTK